MSAAAGEVKDGNAETVIAAEEVRDRLGDIIDRAWDGERFRVSRHAKERVVILGVRDYERLVKGQRRVSR